MCVISGAGAEEPREPFNLNGLYLFAWNGLPFGQMVLKTEENDDAFRAESRIRSAGLAGIFNPHESNSRTEGNLNPRRADWYESYYTTRGKPKHVELVYDKSGKLVEKLIEPPEPPDKRPAIPDTKIKRAANPLSYLFHVRDALQAALSADKDEFEVLLFDGKRMTATHFAIERKATMESGDKSLDVIETTIMRTPDSGYTAKEIKKADKLPITAYFSADGKLTPLLVNIKLSVGSISATLVRTCEGEELCAFVDGLSSKQASNIPLPEMP
jgi:hypothetical protein